MLTSDTMSMLAMSMLMPTSTGAPVEKQHDSRVSVIMIQQPTDCHMFVTCTQRTPAAFFFTSKIRPQTDVIALQQLVHGGFYIGHVARFVSAEDKNTHVSIQNYK